MDRTIHWYVDLYVDRTIHISWHVDVAGGRGGSGVGIPRIARRAPGGGAGRVWEPISTSSVTLFFVFVYHLTLMSQRHISFFFMFTRGAIAPRAPHPSYLARGRAIRLLGPTPECLVLQYFQVQRSKNEVLRLKENSSGLISSQK